MHATLKSFTNRFRRCQPSDKLLSELLVKIGLGRYKKQISEKEFFNKGKLYLFGFLKQEFNSEKFYR